MIDLLYGLMLLFGLVAVMIADDRRIRRQLLHMVGWRSHR
jgi:hypothetical protein